jgi:hypothetical protein
MAHPAGRDADVDHAIGALERSAAGERDTAAWIRTSACR